MPRQTLPSRVLSSWVFVLVAFVATVGPALVFVLSPEARGWIDEHGYAVFWCAVGLCLVLVAALEYQRHQVDPDQRDATLATRFRDELGADGALVTWVRNDFAPNRFSESKWHALEALHLAWTDDPARRFRDKPVQAAYEKCMESLGAFLSRTGDDTWPRDVREGDPGTMGLPQEWKDSTPEMRQRWETAVDEIAKARTAFLTAHSALLATAHGRGL